MKLVLEQQSQIIPRLSFCNKPRRIVVSINLEWEYESPGNLHSSNVQVKALWFLQGWAGIRILAVRSNIHNIPESSQFTVCGHEAVTPGLCHTPIAAPTQAATP